MLVSGIVIPCYSHYHEITILKPTPSSTSLLGPLEMMHVDMLKHQQVVLGPFTAGMGIPQMLGLSKGNLLKTGLISGFGIIVI